MAVIENPVQHKLANQSINYWKIIRIVLSRWYWVAATVLIGYVLAYAYIRSTPEIFITYASLQLDNPDQAQLAASTPAFNYRMRSNQIDAEGLIIRSEDVILKAISKLDYKISYFIEGRIKSSDVYPNKPFKINIIQQDTTNFDKTQYHVKPISNTTFGLTIDQDRKNWETFSYGQVIEMGNMLFSITTPIPAKNYSFKFNSPSDFLGRAVGGLYTGEKIKNTNIMEVTHTDENKYFSADLLNAIVMQYVINDAEKKKRSAIQTIDYLNTQISFLDSAVNLSGNNLSNYQSRNRIIDPQTDIQLSSGKASGFEQQLLDLRLQEISISTIESQVRANNGQNPLSLDLSGNMSAVLPGLVLQYNTLIQEKKAKLPYYNSASTAIQELNARIAEAKNAIVTNISQLKSSNQKTINYVSGKLGAANATLTKIPEKQNDFAKLQNRYNIDEKMYSLMIERKLSAQITRAAVISGASIIDKAIPGWAPISPIKDKIYSTYMFFGLLAGFGLILLVRLMNPYIYDVETVEGLTVTPIIGVILKYPEKIQTDFKRILSLDKPKSIFAESVRSVRTNLSFMASQKTTKVICVTSEISGEGKSFVTVNLAGTLAIIDKKVIVIAADLRRSKLHKTFGSDNKKGLSTYLSMRDSIEDIIGRDEEHFIDFITSGPVPPNPSELLHSPMMQELVEILKEKYEYIIIDTAPVGLVSDSIPLIRNADINLFILRSGVSKFRAATIPDRLAKEYGLNNIAVILNSFGDEKLHSNIYTTNYANGGSGTYYYSDYTGYGNYGYYDNNSRKAWWKFWKK
ncbi:MAG: polysaccharide biosynthesis tyrosine autokinase [Pedobacter sp.]|nr:MAG: polysaccharide biosynthesis tyrosine autokinase [Pedobacter sp.]